MEGEDQATSTAYHIEEAGNFNKVCDQMLSFVKSSNLKKEQIISISTNESQVEEGKYKSICLNHEYTFKTFKNNESFSKYFFYA